MSIARLHVRTDFLAHVPEGHTALVRLGTFMRFDGLSSPVQGPEQRGRFHFADSFYVHEQPQAGS